MGALVAVSSALVTHFFIWLTPFSGQLHRCRTGHCHDFHCAYFGRYYLNVNSCLIFRVSCCVHYSSIRQRFRNWNGKERSTRAVKILPTCSGVGRSYDFHYCMRSFGRFVVHPLVQLVRTTTRRCILLIPHYTIRSAHNTRTIQSRQLCKKQEIRKTSAYIIQ